MDARVSTTAERPCSVIALIGVAHSVSHFFHLAVPVLFPLMKGPLGVSYAELGLLATLFYVASGVSQFIAGFLVDHYGARRILFLGMALVSGAVLLCGFAPSYVYFLVLMPLAENRQFGLPSGRLCNPQRFGERDVARTRLWRPHARRQSRLGGLTVDRARTSPRSSAGGRHWWSPGSSASPCWRSS